MATPSSLSSSRLAERGVHHALLKAAAVADDYAVSLALQLATDADINAADASGRTLLGVAIAGERCAVACCRDRWRL